MVRLENPLTSVWQSQPRESKYTLYCKMLIEYIMYCICRLTPLPNRDLEFSPPECFTSQSSPKASSPKETGFSSPALTSMPFQCIFPYSIVVFDRVPPFPPFQVFLLEHCKALVSLLKPSRILHSAPAVRANKNKMQCIIFTYYYTY